MENYEKQYFMLFTAICDVIEIMECVVNTMDSSDENREELKKQIMKLKAVQQKAEEEYISLC